jgi:hypothetical protein
MSCAALMRLAVGGSLVAAALAAVLGGHTWP